MSNIVCCIILGFFIILGMVDVIKFVILNIFDFPGNTSEKPIFQEIMFPVKADPENIEYIIRNILVQNTWDKNSDTTKMIFSNISGETHKILNVLCKDYPNLKAENHNFKTKA